PRPSERLEDARQWVEHYQHPRPAGGAPGGRDHSFGRLLRLTAVPVRPPGSGRTDQPSRMGQMIAGAAFIAAPSMTTPAVVYRHRAMRSLRARATMVILRIRPPRRRTRSWNHRLSAEAGWFCSHSHANSTIVVR